MRRFLRFLLTLGAFALTAQSALASQVISTSTGTGIKLGVNDKGQALISYTSGGKKVEVIAWGAVNALPPTRGGNQLAFQLDYSGGYTLFKTDLANLVAKLHHDQDVFKREETSATAKGRKYTPGISAASNSIRADYAAIKKIHDQALNYDKTFTCPKYTGPQLAWMVTACTAPDGSFWAVQSWQRLLPDYGVSPTPTQAAWEVHLAHWTGPLPQLQISTDWAWHQWDHLFGSFTYDGQGVYGFASTSTGAPLDTWGRNLYVDTYDSKYGAGWTRENSFLTHSGTGVFCYSFNPHGAHPAGNGLKYRATILGPGVTPDVMWEGTPPGPYSNTADGTANAQIADLHDSLCKPN
jgi:hypothetical protein